MKYTLKGTNNDIETCEKCGKTGLKRVMWLETLDAEGNGTGLVTAMGTTCGAKALGFKGDFSSVEQVTQAVEMQSKKAKAVKFAKIMATEFNDEIAIIRDGTAYVTIRGKAFDANPGRYGMPVQWVK